MYFTKGKLWHGFLQTSRSGGKLKAVCTLQGFAGLACDFGTTDTLLLYCLHPYEIRAVICVGKDSCSIMAVSWLNRQDFGILPA